MCNLNRNINGILVVTEAPAEFLSPLSDKKVMEFETVMFECEVSKPNLKPRWFKGQQEIKDMERFEQTSVGTKHMLTIRECEVQDGDVYKIVVEEGVESAATLTVEGTRTIFHAAFFCDQFFWHDTVVCLSVRLSLTLCTVAKRYIL